MKKWIFTSLAVCVLSCSNTFANNADFDAAQKVIENWFATMKSDPAKAENFLAPQFTSIHTDGIVRNKAQEMELIKKLQMKNYHLSKFNFSQSGDVITVTYMDQGAEKIDHRPISTAPAPRMAVLQKQNDQWLILAYANLGKIN